MIDVDVNVAIEIESQHEISVLYGIEAWNGIQRMEQMRRSLTMYPLRIHIAKEDVRDLESIKFVLVNAGVNGHVLQELMQKLTEIHDDESDDQEYYSRVLETIDETLSTRGNSRCYTTCHTTANSVRNSLDTAFLNTINNNYNQDLARMSTLIEKPSIPYPVLSTSSQSAPSSPTQYIQQHRRKKSLLISLFTMCFT